MCYSAQVVQAARKLSRQLGIRFDYAEAEKLFFRRLEAPSVVISRGFDANFEEPTNDQERRIKGAIDDHRARLATKLEKDLFSQKNRLVSAERSLRGKEIKKAREDVRIATNKIETLTVKLADLRRTETKPRDNRIFPMVYAGFSSSRADTLCSRRCVIFVGRQGSRRSTTRNFPVYTMPDAITWRSSGPINLGLTMQ
jgi:DNA gyrase/topoisomerase IV subunit A